MTYLEVGWTCGRVAQSLTNHTWVHYWSQPWTTEQLSGQHQAVLVGFRKPPTAVLKECVTLHPSRYVTAHDEFYQAFPHVSTASNIYCGEKGWIREARKLIFYHTDWYLQYMPTHINNWRGIVHMYSAHPNIEIVLLRWILCKNM